MKLLPCYAELLMLPGVIQKGAKAQLNDEKITVTCPDPRAMARVLSQYPHVECKIRADNTVSVQLRTLDPQFLLLVWPSGENHGVLIWDNTYYSTLPGDMTQSLIALGHPIATYQCNDGDSFHKVVSQIVVQ